MNIIATDIEGVVLIEPDLFTDQRGCFFESFSQREFDRRVCGTVFVQDNESHSHRGVLRGLHFQAPPLAQSKLVRVVAGRIVDVAVDIRHGSPTFGRHVVVELSGANRRQMFIPRGFAHGFVALEEGTVVQYKCDNYYDRASERGIAWNDPALAIKWAIPEEDMIISSKDRNNPPLADLPHYFIYGQDL